MFEYHFITNAFFSPPVFRIAIFINECATLKQENRTRREERK
jgi:hypothetical protein